MTKQENQTTETWPDLAIGLYDRLTGRNAEITHDFQDFHVNVPSKVGADAKTEWVMNGKLTISTN